MRIRWDGFQNLFSSEIFIRTQRVERVSVPLAMDAINCKKTMSPCPIRYRESVNIDVLVLSYERVL